MNASIRKCYKQDEFVSRIQHTLGANLTGVSCNIVDTEGMTKVMRGAGWSANETHGVVGFQFRNDVYVLDSTPWTVLHELIHRAGVNADRLSRYVAEGLTEAIAQEMKEGDDEHRPTYPEETTWVKTVLLPRLNLTAVELGRKVIQSNDPPRMLAGLMVKAKPGAMLPALERQLQPQVGDRPSFNRGAVTRGPVGSNSSTGAIAAVLLLAGAVLAAPIIFRGAS